MNPVTRTPDELRMDRITAMFGSVPFDNAVFNVAEDLADNYNGGFWDYYEVDGEFLYMAPDQGSYEVTVPGNGFTGTLNEDAFGLVCTLMALGYYMAWLYDTGDNETGERMHDLFYRVREYALDHEKASTIMQAID